MAEEAKQERQKATLRIDEHAEFVGLVDTIFMDTTEICTRIGDVFSGVFHDWYGSRIDIGQNREIITSLFFAEQPQNVPNIENKLLAIERIASKKDTDSVIRTINSFIGGGNSKRYQLTQDGKDILESVIPLRAKNNKGKVEWQNLTSEEVIHNPMNYAGQSQIVYRVIIDLNRFIRLLYGTKDDNGTEYQYMVNLGNPINPVTTFDGKLIGNSWQVFIARLNGKATNEILKKYGFGASNNQGIVR